MNARDLASVLGMPLFLAMAWCISPHRWLPLCRLLGRLIIKAGLEGRGTGPGLADLIRSVVGPRELPVAPESMRLGQVVNNVETWLLLLRALRPGSSGLNVALQGQNHLDAVFRGGRGGILLVHAFRPFIHLLALSAAPYGITRLIGENHGYFAMSRFGRYYLNPIQVAIEKQDHRIEHVIAHEGSFAHMRQLKERFRQNRFVIMRPFPTSLVGTVVVRFMEGWLSLASTPFSLAAESNVPLLPVYSLCDRPGSFRVVVEEPMVVRNGLRRRAVELAAQEHVLQLESYVLRYPDQWTQWHFLALKKPQP